MTSPPDSTTTFALPAALLGAVGTVLGPTPWREVDQATVDRFADATGDHQWIHVDRERAAAGPYGATIAHGYLTLALAGTFVPQLVEVPGAGAVINYGCDRVRFLSPVRVPSRLRGQAVVAEAVEIAGGVQVVLDLTIEVKDAPKPACVVRSVLRYLD